MPEGDTVFHTAETLRQALAGRTLTRCDIRVPRFAAVDLTGQVVDEVLSRGKHLFIRVGPASIHSHMKMDGTWRVGNRRMRVDYRARIVLEAGDVRAVGVDLGVLEILDRAQDAAAVAHLGPDLLGDDGDPQAAAPTRPPPRAAPSPRHCWASASWPGSAMSTPTNCASSSGTCPPRRSAPSPIPCAWYLEP